MIAQMKALEDESRRLKKMDGEMGVPVDPLKEALTKWPGNRKWPPEFQNHASLKTGGRPPRI